MRVMRRVVCREIGPPERLEVETVDAPQPRRRPGRRRGARRGSQLRRRAARRGQVPDQDPPPFTPGSEVAGEIVAVGDGVTGWSVGDRVVATTAVGGFAEYVEIDARSLRAVPASMTLRAGRDVRAELRDDAVRVHAARRCARGETVLVLGAGGGIGLAAVDLARVLGLRPIAAASSRDKLAGAEAQGAFASIAYEDEDLKTRARELSDGGVDLVVDIVGGAHAEPALRALRSGGRYLVIGFASGTIPTVPLNQVLLNNRTVVGVDWGGWAMKNPAEHAALEAELFALAGRGDLRPVEPGRPLAEAGRVLADISQRRIVGKVVLVNGRA